MIDTTTPADTTVESVSVEPVLEVPEFATAAPATEEVVETKEEVLPAPTPSVPSEPNEQATLQKRLKGAISEVEKKNDEVRKIVELQVSLVQDNPDLIHKIAASDPILAQKVIQKVWGTQNIRSYKQLLEKAKLEEIKDSDPDLYETKSQMLQIKADLEASKAKEQEKTKKGFLASKGILDNEYDPNYRLLQEAMDNLNPALVKENPEVAWEMAHKIAFGGHITPVVEVNTPKVAVGGGNKPAPLPAEKPAYSDQTVWLAQQLNEKRGLSIKL